MLPQEIIRRKRDKHILGRSDIYDFINGITRGDIDDSQVAALTMAIFLNGFNHNETIDLTLAMRDSGDRLEWSGFEKPIVDKHSSGGVGDKVSLMLAPILASCDVYVPMIAGRGLGHTGGTIDKLESIPGYNTQADNQLFRQTVKDVGCAIIGQTSRLAPADKKIYAIRDICSTVESIPLITASILSKKLAAGLQYLVMDLKCGNGAFMGDFSSAKALAESIVNVANGAGTKTKAVITDMNQVLGTTAGNAVEVREAIEYLQCKNVDSRLDTITRTLAREMLVQCQRCNNDQEADKLIQNVITSGLALEKFAKMISALGAPVDFMEKYNKYLPTSAFQKPVFAKVDGYISSMDTRAIGLSIIEMKGGRTNAGQALDLATGYSEFAQIGDYIDNHKPLAVIHYQNEEQYQKAAQALLSAISIAEDKPQLTSPILLKV